MGNIIKTKDSEKSFSIIVEEFNTLLTSMDRSSGQKINKAIVVLNDTIDQLNLIDLYKILHP